MQHDQDQGMPAVDLGAAIGSIFDVWKRRWPVIIRFMLAGVFVAATYALLAEPTYKAWASIIIDPRNDDTPTGPETAPLVMTADALIVDSEVKVLKSRGVTLRAIEALGYADGYVMGGPGVMTAVSSWIRVNLGLKTDLGAIQDSNLTEQILKEEARREFVETLDVERSGGTYVIDVVYSASDPVIAAQRVNAVVEAYLKASAERRGSRFDRLNDWLVGRLKQLEGEVREAETELADYRRANQIYEMNGNRLPSEVELATSTQILIDMRNREIELGVRVEKLAIQIELGDVEAVNLPESDRTVALRAFEARYTEILQDELVTIQKRGPNSPIVAQLQDSKDQISKLTLEELQKILGRLVAQQETLARRIATSEQTVEELRLKKNEDAGNQIELRRLERQSQAKQTIFNELLSSFNLSAEMRSFDGSPARVIAWAVPPTEKAAPRSKLLVLLAALGALVLGFVYAFMKDSMDGSLRRAEKLSSLTGFQYLGVIPTMSSEQQRMKEKGYKSWRRPSLFRRRTFMDGVSDLRFAADHPGSVMSETLNALQIQLDWGSDVDPVTQNHKRRDRGLVLGILSTVGDEGKTTLAANLGTLLSMKSASVVLLDLDLARRGLSKRVQSVLPKSNSLEELFLQRSPSALEPTPELEGLTIVANSGSDVINLTNFDDGAELGEILDLLREQFDYVIIDTPALQGLAEAAVLGWLCDKLLFLNQWGVTESSEVRVALERIKPVRDRVVGTMFTKADLDFYLKYNPEQMKGLYY